MRKVTYVVPPITSSDESSEIGQEIGSEMEHNYQTEVEIPVNTEISYRLD